MADWETRISPSVARSNSPERDKVGDREVSCARVKVEFLAQPPQVEPVPLLQIA